MRFSRAGRIVLGQLLDEGLPVSDFQKRTVRLGLPTHVSVYLFPGLYPVQMLAFLREPFSISLFPCNNRIQEGDGSIPFILYSCFFGRHPPPRLP
jgi:hypothetical protein